MEVKVSIIIPAYNIAPYIERCLDSVLTQTLKEIEVLVVDDGSKDATADKVNAYTNRDNRIKLIQKENGGVTSARLAGIREATGEYIGFVDGDDVIEPDMYERLLDNALKYQADISHCGYQMVFPNRVDYYYNTGRLVQQDRIMGLKDLLSGNFVEPGLWNKLFHRKLFHGLMYTDVMPREIKNNEDLLMNYLLFRESTGSVFEDWCPYHYMIRKGSAATAPTTLNKLMDPLRVMKFILQDACGTRDVYLIVYARYLRVLIGIAAQQQWKGEAQRARMQLKKEVSTPDFRFNVTDKKTRAMAFTAAYMPPIYKFVRDIYDKTTGISKKYDV